jgi:hypothetical protein
MFLSCLKEDFQSEVYTCLSSIRAARPTVVNKRAEDLYQLEDVMEAAMHLAEGPSGMLFADMSLGAAVQITLSKEHIKIKAEVDEIQQVITGLQD